MKQGAWAATAADSVIVAKDANRGVLTIQWHADDDVFISFGPGAAVKDSGIKLNAVFPTITVSDYRAMEEVHAICETSETAKGGWATA